MVPKECGGERALLKQRPDLASGAKARAKQKQTATENKMDTVVEGFVAISVDVGVVDKDVGTRRGGDESKALLGVEPFNCSGLRHCYKKKVPENCKKKGGIG